MKEAAKGEGVEGNERLVADVVVGGVKERPMKWRGPHFIAPGLFFPLSFSSFCLFFLFFYYLRIY